jgi:hypothetical protein
LPQLQQHPARIVRVIAPRKGNAGWKLYTPAIGNLNLDAVWKDVRNGRYLGLTWLTRVEVCAHVRLSDVKAEDLVAKNILAAGEPSWDSHFVVCRRLGNDKIPPYSWSSAIREVSVLVDLDPDVASVTLYESA